jgi:ribosome-associated protein
VVRKSRRSRSLDDHFQPEEDAVDDDAGEAEEAEDADAPSRTARKNASKELQQLGQELAALRAERLATLDLPEPLRDALAEAKRLTNFGAKRRQALYVGKLMRKLDAKALAAVRQLVSRARGQ